MVGQAVDRMRTFLGKGALQECASLFSGAVQKNGADKYLALREETNG